MAFIRAIFAIQSVYVAYIHHTLWNQFGVPACACADVLLPPVVAGFTLPLQLSFLKSDCATMVGSFTSSYWLAHVEAPGAKSKTGMALRWHHHALMGRKPGAALGGG